MAALQYDTVVERDIADIAVVAWARMHELLEKDTSKGEGDEGHVRCMGRIQQQRKKDYGDSSQEMATKPATYRSEIEWRTEWTIPHY